jgi:hypothetical protein
MGEVFASSLAAVADIGASAVAGPGLAVQLTVTAA